MDKATRAIGILIVSGMSYFIAVGVLGWVPATFWALCFSYVFLVTIPKMRRARNDRRALKSGRKRLKEIEYLESLW